MQTKDSIKMSPPEQLDTNELKVLPPDIDDSYWPRIKLKRLTMVNFGKHKNVTIEFLPEQVSMNCLVGQNGAGKTTILNAVYLLFSNFTGYEKERLKALTLKNVRNHMLLKPEEIDSADFKVEGVFQIDDGTEYTISVNRDGVSGKHPENIQKNLQYYCYAATFDRELHLFQLKRDRWPQFKELMEAVTGYSIEEDVPVFQLDSDPKFQRIMRDYIIAFKMDKGREIIGHRQCSAGERKIIRTFSALLNRPSIPSIILIDNVTDHMEASRHIRVIDALEKTFNKSQIIVTCHSAPVQKFLPNQSRLLDMRLLNASNESERQFWKFKIEDELEDLLLRLNAFSPSNEAEKTSVNILIEKCLTLLTESKMDICVAKDIYDNFKELAMVVFDLTLRPEKDLPIRMSGG